MLRSDLSIWLQYSEACIVVKRRISVAGNNLANRVDKKLTFKNNAPFSSCISKINNTFKDNAEDLDIVILIYRIIKEIK